MSLTVRLGESVDASEVGGKGANLAALIAGGFPVPPGFVVTTSAYREFIASAGLAGTPPERLRDEIRGASIPEPIAAAILSGYGRLGSPPVAVRSSGTAEDLHEASFAGQHDSYLDVVGGDALLTAVRDCWASLWTRRAVAYRERISWEVGDLALAVVVQRMVRAEWAGVMFTADPISGRRDRIVVEAISGLGDALASGEATGRHCEIDKSTGAIVSGAQDMPADALRELVALGREVETSFGEPQDIEWARAGDDAVALVQTRPLTALPEEHERSRRRSRRESKPLGAFAITADHMPYPPYPIDVSLVYGPALTWVLDAVGAAGFTAPPLDEVLVEIDDGVVQIVPPRVRPGWAVLWRAPRAVPALIRAVTTSTDAWSARSKESLVPLAERREREDLSTLSEAELAEQMVELMGTVGRLMPSRFGALVSGMAAEEAGKMLLRVAVGRDRARLLHAGLMADVPCVLTSANADLERMAAIVRGTPELLEAYSADEPRDIAGRLVLTASGRAMGLEVEAHLRAFGYRAVSIFTVGHGSLRDEPWIVHGHIRSLVGRDGRERSAEDLLGRARAELAADTRLRARTLRPVVGRLFAVARSGAGFRDDSQYALEMSLAVTRRLLLELGRRLVDRDILARAGDVVFLSLDEIAAIGAVPPEDIRRAVERRRAAREASLDHYTVVPAEMLGADLSGGVRGTPASRGRFVGRVRVVHDESEFATLVNGEVLVCPFTNPTWTPLFSVAGAVVVDSGGATSHAAIVAREVGIPAVMGTGDGSRILSTGQRVLVDADRGVVMPLGAPA